MLLKSLLIIKQYSILMRVHSNRIRNGMMNKCLIYKRDIKLKSSMKKKIYQLIQFPTNKIKAKDKYDY